MNDPVIHNPEDPGESVHPPDFLQTIWHRIQNSPAGQKAQAIYIKHRRFAPAAFFFGGVAWDAGTLNRIDAWIDIVFIIVYFILLGACITAVLLTERDRVTHALLMKYRKWYPAGIQFFLGALFSTYVIFYLQSASLTSTSLFFLVLVTLLVANEFIRHEAANLYLLMALYYLAGFSFFVFFVPVITKVMNYWTFFAGSALSLGLVIGMLYFIKRAAVFKNSRPIYSTIGLVIGLFLLLNLFYMKDWIPPVPLALRYGGIYHYAAKKNDDRQGELIYELRYAKPRWFQFWVNTDKRFLYAEGDTVYCFTAIFAPTQLSKEIYHNWSHYDDVGRQWVTTDRINYHIEGGRDTGYRGFTLKRHIMPGSWRVDVRTSEGKTLGRIRFSIIPVETPVTEFARIQYE